MPSTKRGLGWPYDHPASLYHLYTSPPHNVTWLFNWELYLPASLPSTLQWTPQIRLASSLSNLDPYLTSITGPQHHPVHQLIGFNEPDNASQSNLPVNEAVSLWKQHVLPAKSKYHVRLGSPAMTSDTKVSIPWLDSFFHSLGGPSGAGVEFLVLHWYGRSANEFRGFVEEMHNRYKLPVWVTEFACQGAQSVGEVKGFMKESVSWLESTPWVERYAYFGQGVGGTVGSWVGEANDLLTKPRGGKAFEGVELSEVGKYYCEL